MAIAVVVAIGFLLMLWLVLSTVRRLRPGTFRLKATLTKWVTLDLEMRSPEGDNHRATSRRRRRDPAKAVRHGTKIHRAPSDTS